MSTDELFDKYVALWNEEDAERRRERVIELWTPDARQVLKPPAEVEPPTPEYAGFAVPLRLRWGDDELRLLSTLTHFGTAVDVTVAELRLEAFLPADAPTGALLSKLDGA